MDACTTEDGEGSVIASLLRDVQDRLQLAAHVKRQRPGGAADPDEGGAAKRRRHPPSSLPGRWAAAWEAWDRFSERSGMRDEDLLGLVKEAMGEGGHDSEEDTAVTWSTSDGAPLRWAAAAGHGGIVAHILSAVPPAAPDRSIVLAARDCEALRMASRNGHTGIVISLLHAAGEGLDPSIGGSEALRLASAAGHLGVVDALLRDGRVDPSAVDSEALRLASAGGHADVVQLLLRHEGVSPAARDSEALHGAVRGGHVDVVRLLLEDGRADPTAGDADAYKPLWHARQLARRGRTADVRRRAAAIIELLAADERVAGDPDSLMTVADHLRDVRAAVVGAVDGRHVSLAIRAVDMAVLAMRIAQNLTGFWPAVIAGGGLLLARAYASYRRGARQGLELANQQLYSAEMQVRGEAQRRSREGRHKERERALPSRVQGGGAAAAAAKRD